MIVQGPTWEEAEANAVKLGGHLVTINDAAENDWLFASGLRGWIGFTDKAKEGDWVWSSGEQVTYTNWLPDSPSNSWGIEHYANNGSSTGAWGDSNNIGDGNGGPNIKGIAEIKLAPNNAPTGSPSITGTLKAGSTLSIDASAIQDADNFSGYTPSYQYAWEVSSDGSNWSKLATTDATDNNSTYTLTTADAGKQIRGVVSYLDGYGTNEVLNSASKRISSVDAPTQQVTSVNSQFSYLPSTSVSIPLQYTTSTGDSQLSGLTLNVHYNSSILTPTSPNNGVSNQLPAAIVSNAVIADSNNLDNDPLTDKILQLIWASFDNSFPNKSLPTTLAALTFNTSSQKIDPLTGSPISTALRYTASETAASYDFLTSSTTLNALPFSLDVDGDGQVKALTDGLMIIRKLLGPAFAGDALTYKAVGSGATRPTSEIHSFIQSAIDLGALDIDKDGKTGALTDGLRIIRRLLGHAFDGNALTYKALGSESPYFGSADAFTSVAANIDALRPSVFPPVTISPF